ncbi:MAG: hypothetical protein ABMA25_04195 [Ilumatobacteraceae bacterium]
MRRFLVPLALLASLVAVPSGRAAAAADPTRGQAAVLIEQVPGLPPTVSGYQSQGGTPTVAHTAPDQWTVRLGGLTGLGGNVQLTQYVITGEGGRGYCAIESWGPDATAMIVKVRCWEDDGSPATQVSFGVLFNNSRTLPSTAYEAFWNGNGTFTGPITPPSTWVMNHTPRLTRTSVGHYTVEYLGTYTNPFPLVTGWGTTPRVCNVVDWSTGRSTISPHHAALFVRVACFTFTGFALDSGFSFLLSSRSPLGVDKTTGGRVLTTTAASWTTPPTENVNTTSGVAQATNSFRTVLGAGGWSTEVSVPGYPGAPALFTAADTLESVGDDATRCFLEDPLLRQNGAAHLLVICIGTKGNSVPHRVHSGTWEV